MDVGPPSGAWLPVKVAWHENRAWLRWLHFGERRLHEPFFEGDVRACLRQPFNRLFTRLTPIEAAADRLARWPGLPPDGFVFHMSRCGSTLAAQMLAATPDTIVVAEAAPIDAIVKLWYANAAAPREVLADWLRWVVGALGHPRFGECRYVLKLDPWHTMALPLFRAAFPATPWVFLYREPLEIMVSQADGMGAQMFPNLLADLGAALVAGSSADPLDHCARVLAAIGEAALQHDDAEMGQFIRYDELPDAVRTRLVPHFRFDAAAFVESATVTKRDVKRPSAIFTPDGAAKRAAATEEVRRLADIFLGPVFARLDARRAADKLSPV